MINSLEPTEAAYIAGIVDGEGTIALSRLHRNEGRRPVVSISSTERSLLEFIQSAVGSGRITSKVCSRSHHTPSFAYCLTNHRALVLLEQIGPYLKTYKSKRATLLLREYRLVTRRNGRYTPIQLQAKEDF